MNKKTKWKIFVSWYWRHSASIGYKIFYWKDLGISLLVVGVYFIVNRQVHADISKLYSTLFASFSTALAFILAGLPVLLTILKEENLADIRKKYGAMIIWVYKHSCIAIFACIFLLGLGMLGLGGTNNIGNLVLYQCIVILFLSIATLATIRCFYLLFKCADRIMKKED